MGAESEDQWSEQNDFESDVYDDNYIDSLLEGDQLREDEAGFMHGYNHREFGGDEEC